MSIELSGDLTRQPVTSSCSQHRYPVAPLMQKLHFYCYWLTKNSIAVYKAQVCIEFTLLVHKRPIVPSILLYGMIGLPSLARAEHDLTADPTGIKSDKWEGIGGPSLLRQPRAGPTVTSVMGSGQPGSRPTVSRAAEPVDSSARGNLPSRRWRHVC